MKKSMIFVPDKIFTDKQLTTYAKVCYIVLMRHANKYGVCYPSRKRIAQMGGFGITTYKKAVRLLEKYGYIRRLERYKRTHGRTSNLFIINKSYAKNGFFQVRRDVFELGLSAREIAVYCCLCKCGAESGCVPLQSQIAEYCGISVKTVISAVKSLKNQNLIETYQTKFANGSYSGLYYMLTEPEQENRTENVKKNIRIFDETINRITDNKLFSAVGKLKNTLVNCKNYYMRNVLNIPAVTFATGGYYLRDLQ